MIDSKMFEIKRLICLCAFLWILHPQAVFANSSWHWVTISPMKVLPLAIALTLITETLGISILGKIKNQVRTFLVILLANIASFTLPYIYNAYRLTRFYGEGFIYAWERAFNSGPHYIIQSAYLILTLCIELPLVYLFLRKHTSKKFYLIVSIISFNTVTTLLVAILERLLCKGRW